MKGKEERKGQQRRAKKSIGKERKGNKMNKRK